MNRPDPAAPASVSPADVRVVRGAPDDMELAALVAGLVAAASGPSAPDAIPHSAWGDRSRTLPGGRTGPSADSWRWSLRA